jgi:hypothetical protein
MPVQPDSCRRSAVRRGIGVTATEWPPTFDGVHALPPRRRLATVEDIIVGVVKSERTVFLDSRLREHLPCEHQRQHSMAAALRILNLVIAFPRETIGCEV